MEMYLIKSAVSNSLASNEQLVDVYLETETSCFVAGKVTYSLAGIVHIKDFVFNKGNNQVSID